MSKRIYVVAGEHGIHLVRASTPSQALSHIAKNEYSTCVATQEHLVTLLGKGKEIQNAAAVPVEQDALDL